MPDINALPVNLMLTNTAAPKQRISRSKCIAVGSDGRALGQVSVLRSDDQPDGIVVARFNDSGVYVTNTDYSFFSDGRHLKRHNGVKPEGIPSQDSSLIGKAAVCFPACNAATPVYGRIVRSDSVYPRLTIIKLNKAIAGVEFLTSLDAPWQPLIHNDG